MNRDNDSGCLGLIVFAIAAFFVWKWVDGGGAWTGWVYPDASDLTQSVRLGEFKNFEQCQEAAINGLRSLSVADVGDYECGRGCRFDSNYGMDICKETRK